MSSTTRTAVYTTTHDSQARAKLATRAKAKLVTSARVRSTFNKLSSGDPLDVTDQFFADKKRLSREARGLAQAYSTALLSDNFDPEELERLHVKLNGNGISQNSLQKCMRSRFTMREALGNSPEYHLKWLEALKRVGVSNAEVIQALTDAQRLQKQYAGRPHEELQEAVYKLYFAQGDLPRRETKRIG